MQTDYIIVGAGSAGSVLALRLAEAGRTVLVVEHGGTDLGPLIQMPAALSYPLNMRLYDWGYRTEPEPNLGGRRLACPRGKVVGGSSSINGMVFVRGHALDFDRWAELGAAGWSYADVLPYFKRMETARHGDPEFRGRSGPMHARRASLVNPLFTAFIDAGGEAGFPFTPDLNGAQQEGMSAFQQTIRDGRRWSAANAYLRPALATGRATITRALARRVVFEGRRAVGVEVDAKGRIEVLRAGREVIVAAGAINAPKLLLHSGIGAGAALQALAIPVVADRPGVGANLQDHLEVYIQFACRAPITLNAEMGLLSKARIGLQWLLLKTGKGATNHFEAGAFLRSAPGVRYPDIQLHFLPAAIRYDGYGAAARHGFQVHAGPMRSPSRGAVTIASADPHAAPVIRFNYMSDPSDWGIFRRAIRLVREIAARPALMAFNEVELSPGPAVQSDAEIDAFVRDHAESAYHPCGTCRIGRADDPLAVVDPQCRVIGVEGLRVADSSVFPAITNGNINVPTMMVGEKAADHILGRQPLPRANAEPWINPRWQAADR